MKKVKSLSVLFTRDINDFRLFFEGLFDDFGYPFWHTILLWCHIIDSEPDKRFWRIWILKNGSLTLGICGLYSLDDKNTKLWLGWFGILPKFRSQGIGKLALDFLEYKARRSGCQELYSYVGYKNRKALKFYKNNGFKVISDVKTYCANNGISKKMMTEEFEDPNDLVIIKMLNGKQE